MRQGHPFGPTGGTKLQDLEAKKKNQILG
uniref:Uncharacterized protein n=1 Tax=Rhizophora mucronata TaxID=61149 RepID=A0A2P2QA80_RHIMU